MRLSMKNFNSKISLKNPIFLGGGHKKTNVSGGLLKKKRRLGFRVDCRLKGELGEKKGDVFWGGADNPMHTEKYYQLFIYKEWILWILPV